MYDVIIVGASLSGLMAASELKGLNFICIDSKKKIGLPLKCGEGIRKQDFLEIFNTLKFPFILNEVSQHKILYNKLERTFKEPYLQLDRTKFEQFLASKLKDKIKLNTKLLDIEIKKDKAIVITDKGNLETKLVILCYGTNFKIQEKFNLIKKKPKIAACYGGIFKNHKLPADAFYFHFNPQNTGYLWVFPKNKQLANIGFGGLNVKDLKITFYNLLKEKNLNVELLKEFSGVFPVNAKIKNYYKRLLICGTAAAQIYSGTGEGIYFALKSGKIAGKVAFKACHLNKSSPFFLKQHYRECNHYFKKRIKGGKIFYGYSEFGVKYNKTKKIFNGPSEEELRKIIVEGKFPFRAKLVYPLIRVLNHFHKSRQTL